MGSDTITGVVTNTRPGVNPEVKMSLCGKVVYNTRSKAKSAFKTLKKVGKGNLRRPKDPNKGDKLKPYRCRNCGMRHLTSRV